MLCWCVVRIPYFSCCERMSGGDRCISSGVGVCLSFVLFVVSVFVARVSSRVKVLVAFAAIHFSVVTCD
jgi:hypothetical protein